MPSEPSEPRDESGVPDDVARDEPVSRDEERGVAEPESAAPASAPVADEERGAAAPEPESAPVPAEDELERTATPATVRRAPKFSAFITFGALGGLLVGLLIAVIFHPGPQAVADGSGLISFLDGEGSIRAITAVAVGVLGAFVGGALAVRADRRSRAPRTRR